MTDSIFPTRPESWPAFWADIVNKVGFAGPLFGGILFLIKSCGNDKQQSVLVDAVLLTHPNIVYSLVFWGAFIFLFANYGIQRHTRKKSLQSTIEEQEKQLRSKDLYISTLRDEIISLNPGKQRMEQLDALFVKITKEQ
jgi:hypothetical protein